MSSFLGLYANFLCSDQIVKAGISMGVKNRTRELLHFALMSNIDKYIIKYPFYNQFWDKDIAKEFGQEFNFPQQCISPKTVRKVDKMWWDDIYLDNNKSTIKRIISNCRHKERYRR